MLDLIARHIVREPVVPDYLRQIGLAESIAQDGRVVKNRTGRCSDIEPEDCEMVIQSGKIENPCVLRFSVGSQRYAQS